MNLCTKCHRKRESSYAYCATCERRLNGQKTTFVVSSFPKSSGQHNKVVARRGAFQETHKFKYGSKHNSIKQVRTNNWTIH